MNLSSKVWQDPAYFIAFGFGSGLAPVAPGTWGTLAAFPIYLLMSTLSLPLYLLITLVFFILGVYVSNRVSADLGEHDYSGIVWDEVVGFLLTMALVPSKLAWMIIGFLLFRLFDIWKPWPITIADEKIKGGFGIMFDDVLAAVPAWIILQLLIWSFS
ncbi:phosphatidylglycerophosphatase A [Legionella quinlivanii]|uniref:Phosphatidylglycerophosphatase A n=1 Tax=Legionella quinlivanii TaxID=45073 RepID=A0A0W0Y8T4_9GAMM|nr:phosphatidylglycerophosphatase A [Legionella quinlivanii]KTD53058.1 phosphatidylglycerophosphatase A [Legionella quinlivanii]MCW8451364.1 phosphatidylglycerophosphatase A [Legionella quinlivanii]SEG16461.1 phosphatidylglycerophosphatase [Legionella quinlivanii DSM 21216]STY10438.1 phosphatidylglycerophosphatase A [Legionella quinlivanii]